MSTDLKPCPFCGGEAIMKIQRHVPKGYEYTPTCKNTSCAGRLTKKWLTEAEAIEAWNRRAERTVKPKKGAYDLIRCDCGMPVSSNYDYCPKCKAKLDWSVEKCQPETTDDFENANRKGNDERFD